jgi:tripartite-type tricarboxylate transporter receptor subunit TctC
MKNTRGTTMKKSHAVAGIALLCLAALCFGAGVRSAWSAEKPYPNHQFTYLVCFDPGGQSDREARRQAPLLEKFFGQKVIIDYKIGGGGALGWRTLTKAKPDGYTFAGFNIPHVILQPLQQDVGYKTEQINPVFIFHKTPLALAVLETSPFKTLKDLIDHAKKNPFLVSVGGSGAYTGYHMATLRFEKLIGTRLTYVPYTGAAPQMTSFLGGHIVAVFGASDDLTRYRDKIRVLGFATEKRFPGFPDVPTLKEQGFDMVEGVDRGIAVPPNTPANVIKTLEAAFMDIARRPEFQEEQRKGGFIPLAMGHEEVKEYMKKMTVLYTELAKGLKK